MQNIFQWFVLFGVYVSETATNYADLVFRNESKSSN